MNKIKYGRTYHLPWTQSSTSDDKILTKQEINDHFAHMNDCFVSEKRDGENTTIGRGYSHARSIDSKDHWSRHHIKQLAANLYSEIPDGWRICGENLIATHSLEYSNLDSFFEVFSIWNEHNVRLDLDETLEYCDLLKLKFVPIIARGSYKHIVTKKQIDTNFRLDLGVSEGYVIANSNGYHYDDARKNMGKFVREGHVQTEDKHWMLAAPRKNSLV